MRRGRTRHPSPTRSSSAGSPSTPRTRWCSRVRVPAVGDGGRPRGARRRPGGRAGRRGRGGRRSRRAARGRRRRRVAPQERRPDGDGCAGGRVRAGAAGMGPDPCEHRARRRVPDALAMGPHVGEERSPLLLTTGPDALGPSEAISPRTAARWGCGTPTAAVRTWAARRCRADRSTPGGHDAIATRAADDGQRGAGRPGRGRAGPARQPTDSPSDTRSSHSFVARRSRTVTVGRATGARPGRSTIHRPGARRRHLDDEHRRGREVEVTEQLDSGRTTS